MGRGHCGWSEAGPLESCNMNVTVALGALDASPAERASRRGSEACQCWLTASVQHLIPFYMTQARLSSRSALALVVPIIG